MKPIKGIEYLVDESGVRRAVVIDLAIYGELWEDIYDAIVANDRKDEPREALDEVKQRLSGAGG